MLSESDVEDQLLGLMNDERAANGLPPYVRDGALDAGARAHTELLMSKAVVAADPNDPVCPAQTDVPVETWTESWQEDHWCPGEEPSPIQRIQPDWQTRSGIAPTENVGRGWAFRQPPDPGWEPYDGIVSDIHHLFMAEVPPDDGHRRAILSPDHDSVGVGVRIFTRTEDVGGDQQQQAYVRFTVDFAKP
jgi:hypothetical protein